MIPAKTAVITGASRGIGLAVAQLFLRNGWRVIGTHHATVPPIKSTSFISMKVDLSSTAEIDRAVLELMERTSAIDVLVNNAGILLDGLDQGADMQKIRATFEVNLFAVIDLSEQLIPLMIRGSHIININSDYGAQSFPIDDETHVGYRLSKASLNMYTRILAFRLQEKGIVVSSLDPGWVKTDMGVVAATETEQPDRESAEVAQEIYDLATQVTESGFFWRSGQKRDW